MAAIIRLATANDAEQIQAIYAPNVLSTAISFELEPPRWTQCGSALYRRCSIGLGWCATMTGRR